MTRALLVSPLALPFLLLACGAPQQPATETAPTALAVSPPPSATATAKPAESAGSGKLKRSVSGAGGTMCAISEGGVMCWGDNRSGVVGQGLPIYVATPVRIAEVTDAVAVANSGSLGCALTAQSKVRCWGHGDARDVNFGGPVADISIDDDVVYAVLKDGTIKALNPVYSREEPEVRDTPALKEVASIAATGSHVCAVHTSGEVSCWGALEQNGSGVDASNMGYGPEREELEKKPVKVKGLTDAVQVAAARNHTCALRKTKQVVCWGENYAGELGVPSDTSFAAEPVAVPLLEDAVELAAGDDHTCARRASGKLVCWGRNGSGQLGGGLPLVTGLVEVHSIADATGVAAAEEVSCATRAAGEVACWGAATRGRLGNGTLPQYTRPMPVAGVSGAVALGLGDGYSCALDGKGQVSCWGLPTSYSRPKGAERGVPPKPVGDGAKIESMTSSSPYVCSVTTAGVATCIDLRGSADPVKLEALGKVKTVEWRAPIGAALSPSGQVTLFGTVTDYKKNKTELKTKPLAALSGATDIGATSSHVCALKKTGKVACVGFHYRTFAAKDAVEPTAAIEIPGVTDAVGIEVSTFAIHIIHKTGEVSAVATFELPRAEEKKKPGAAPDKKEKSKPRPLEVKRVKGLTDAVKVSSNAQSTCALRKDGTVMCWGSNSDGELGTGDFEYHSEPVAVVGLKDVAAMATGESHACAAKKSGEVLCWGRNTSDEAGQQTPAYYYEPVAVQKPAK